MAPTQSVADLVIEWSRWRTYDFLSVDLEDVLMLVLHYFTWLVMGWSVHITVQTMSDPLWCQRVAVGCVYVHPDPIERNWHDCRIGRYVDAKMAFFA